MIHVFKLGGDWEVNGVAYTVECINESALSDHLGSGWVKRLDELEPFLESGDDVSKRSKKSVKQRKRPEDGSDS